MIDTPINFVVYAKLSGWITSVGMCPANMVRFQGMDRGLATEVLEVDTDTYSTETHMVRSGTVVKRPALSGPSSYTMDADGESEITIEGIPLGSTITVRERDLQVFNRFYEDEGTFVFATDEPGNWVIQIAAFPYLDAEYTIVAT